jgi:hypothetical protein
MAKNREQDGVDSEGEDKQISPVQVAGQVLISPDAPAVFGSVEAWVRDEIRRYFTAER